MHPRWKQWLSSELGSPQHRQLLERVDQQEKDGVLVLPRREDRLRVFSSDPLDLRVVIIGQDPYPTPGHAMGLAFSVPPGVSPPRSLVNIYKEIEAGGGQSAQGRSGDLTGWERQGVFLLNSILTVQAHRPLSHANWGWERLTQLALVQLSENHPGLVFMLWGGQAKKIALQAGVDPLRHFIIHCAHPSPLSAYRGFLGSGVFNRANQWLENTGRTGIVW